MRAIDDEVGIDIAAVVQNLPERGHEKMREQVEAGGLARAVGPIRANVTAPDLQVDVVDDP